MFAFAIVLGLALSESAEDSDPSPWADNNDDRLGTHVLPLSGHTLPNLVRPHIERIAIKTDDLGGSDSLDDTVVLEIPASFQHDFDGSVSNLQATVAIFPNTDFDLIWRRLTAPPLSLLPNELDAELTPPIHSEFFSVDDQYLNERFTKGRDVSVHGLEVYPQQLPKYLLFVDHYELHDPSTSDIIKIIEHGGAADNAALLQWARERYDAPSSRTPEENRAVVEAIETRLLTLRAPPRLGDFQRLQAWMGCLRIVGSASDVATLLAMERPIKILHIGAIVSYEAALHEEGTLRLNVHGMNGMPSRSDFLASPTLAMRSLRPRAVAELLRLAYDPLDFGHGKDHAFAISELQPQAIELLTPVHITNVNAALHLAAGKRDVEREIFRFYIRVHHTPLVEPFLAWLMNHPEEISGIGVDGARELPDAMLPIVLQHYIEPEEPATRDGMRTLLLSMPTAIEPRIVEILNVKLETSGDSIPLTTALDQALDAFERHEHAFSHERALELAQTLVAESSDPQDLRQALRDTARLAQLAPELLEQHALPIIELHKQAAVQFYESGPRDRSRALFQLATFPFGVHTNTAHETREILLAQADVREGNIDAALERLLSHDQALASQVTRSAFSDIVCDRLERELEHGDYRRAHQSLDVLREHVADTLDISDYERRLFWVQYRPAIILATAFGLALISTLIWLVVRSGMVGLARMRIRRRDYRRLLRRVEDAEANKVDTALLNDDDSNDDDSNDDDSNDDDSNSDDHPAESQTPRTQDDYDSFTDDWSS